MAFKRMFSYAKVDVPNRSGHNVDHRHAFSAKCGTLVPSFCDFLIPGDTVDLAPKFSVQMAPQATDFIGRISLRTELFFVPLRAVWAGWKDFITYASEGIGGPAPDDPNYHAKYIPGAKFTGSAPYNSTAQVFVSPGYTLPSISGEYVNELLQRSLVHLDSDSVKNDIESAIFNDPSNPFPFYSSSLLDYLGFKITDGVPYFNSKVKKFLAQSVLQNVITDFESLRLISDDIASSLSSSTFYQGTPQSHSIYYYNEETNYQTILSYTFTPIIVSSFNPPQIVLGFSDISISARLNQEGSETLPVSNNDITINNILPAVCYHKIWDDWYRDARLMKKLFPNALGDNPQNLLGNIAYITKFGGGFTKKFYQGDQLKFYDGKSLFDLRQRLWQKDFFTTMTQAPQSGDAMKVQVTPDADNPAISGEFTIASLRLANAMQLWRERNNLVDSRYGDVQYAQYGVYPSDAVTDRAIYLGSNTVEIYNKSVYQQGEYDGPTNNPIKGIGTKYATPVGVGQGNLCNNYSVTEHGFLMALTSIVPEPSYSSGTRRFFHYDTIDDIAFPLLQGVGDQPVYAREIIDTYSGDGDKTVIGYTGRYSEYKFINDHISGLLRDGESLSAFALQRSFSEPPVLGADFLEIPVDYLDQVSAVGVENSKYGAWIESYWRYSKVSCLSEYNAVPTLGRMPDVHQITVNKAGSRL